MDYLIQFHYYVLLFLDVISCQQNAQGRFLKALKIKQAVEDVKAGRLISWQAYRKYNIPHYSIHGKVKWKTSAGSHSILSHKILIHVTNDNIKFRIYVIVEYEDESLQILLLLLSLEAM